MNESSSICPAAHHSALFLIQLGMGSFSGIVGVVGEPGPISIIAEPIPAYVGS